MAETDYKLSEATDISAHIGRTFVVSAALTRGEYWFRWKGTGWYWHTCHRDAYAEVDMSRSQASNAAYLKLLVCISEPRKCSSFVSVVSVNPFREEIAGSSAYDSATLPYVRRLSCRQLVTEGLDYGPFLLAKFPSSASTSIWQ